MSEIDDATPIQPAGLNVIVSKMPDKPAKPLLRDPNRLLSLAAFVFSVSTGVFATYNTWRSSREATVDNVSKLTSQYYDGQSKLAQLNQSQQGYINLLRTTLRSTALRAIAQASLVKTDIDEGTWLALAQINDNENNLAASQIAWTAATEVTHDISIYLFGMRGLASNRLRQGDLAGANAAFDGVIKAALADTFKSAPNSYTREYRYVEAAATEGFWLTTMKAPDCAFISSHFDNVLRNIAELHTTANPADPGYLSELVGTRVNLNYFRRARLACGTVNEEILSADDCFAIGEVASNAPYGFFNYRGNPLKPGDADSDLYSLYYAPDAESCLITSSSNFYCSWPESDEAGTSARANGLVDKLTACKNLSGVKKTTFGRETASRSWQTTSFALGTGATIRVVRTQWKAKDGSTTDWSVALEIAKS